IIAVVWRISLESSDQVEKGAKIYQSLVEGSSNIVVLIDIYGNIITINSAGRNELGISDSNISEKRLPEFWNEKSQALVREAIQRALVGQKSVCEAEKTQPDGSTSYWELILNPIIEEENTPKELIGIFHNFTQRKIATQELLREQDLINNILNTAQTIILLLDMSGKVLRINKHFFDLTDYRFDEVIGQNWFEKFIPEIDLLKVSSYFRQYSNNFGMEPLVNRVKAKNGRLINIEWRNRTIKNDKGIAIGVISVGQDITHHLQLESTLRSSRSKFAMLVNSFVRFGNSPEENISILNEAIWMIAGADTVFIKENINGQLAQISFASLIEEGKVGTQTNCIIKPGIESLGKDPILVQNLRSFGADCKCLQI
ncbi:MAG: PAS domain-containing protein, partial [Candidatus Riflebacteria bacterium]